MKRHTSSGRIAKMFSVSPASGMEAVIKAQLISAILKEVEREGWTHGEIAKRAELSRSAVTGILSGSLQKVTIDRILKIVGAVGLVADVRVAKAASRTDAVNPSRVRGVEKARDKRVKHLTDAH